MATLQDFLQSMSNSAASNVSAPVDGINWLLRKGGLPVSDAPFMGSDWMEQKGFTKPVQQGAASVLGETAGMVAPFAVAAKAPQIAKGLLQAGENAMAPAVLNKQAGAVFVYPQDKALATAQRNAALPVKQGGLGLRADNTPMERAGAMGFADDAYHGTGSGESIANRGFDSSFTGKGNDQLGSGFYTTTDPLEASTYSHAITQNRVADGAGKLGGADSPAVMPLMVNRGRTLNVKGSNLNESGVNLTPVQAEKIINKAPNLYDVDETPIGNWHDVWGSGVKPWMVKDVAKSYKGESLTSLENDFFKADPQAFRNAMTDVLGLDSVTQKFGDKSHYVLFRPNQMRSKFAAFDPMRRNEADLLGRADPRLLGLLGGGAAGAAYLSQDK